MKYLVCSLLIFINVACSKSYIIDKEPNMPVQQFTNYAWNELKEIGNSPYYSSSLLDKNLSDYLDSRMHLAGYKKTSSQNADIYIDYHIYIDEGTYEQTVCPAGFYRANRYSPELSGAPQCEVPEVLTTYDTGSLVIDIVHKNTGQIIWRGSAFELIENPIYADVIFQKKIKNLLKDIKIKK